jgi:hypothetical protein
MRKWTYIAVLIISVIAVLLKAGMLRDKDKREIISRTSEWARHGKPVDVYAADKGTIFSLENVSGIVTRGGRIIAKIPAENVYALKQGQQFYASGPEGTLKGYVRSVSQSRSVLTGLYDVSLQITEGAELPEGSIATVKVKTMAYRNATRVPSLSVLKDNGHRYVWVVKDNTASKRHVKTGAECDYYIHIVRGIKKGEEVCVRGMSRLNDNDKVRIRKIETTAVCN